MKRFLPLLPLTVLVACIMQTTGMTLTDAILTLTATASTPTITVTPAPNTASLVELLNGNLIGTDPLSETVDARYYVTDLRFAPDDQNNLIALRVHVECECVYSSCCTNERTFVQLIRAFVANQKTLSEIQAQMPVTVRDIQVVSFERMQEKGMIMVLWSDVLLYAAGQINGNQLGSRIVRLTP
jgi:hypothetical protein